MLTFDLPSAVTVYAWHGDLSPQKCRNILCIAQVHHRTTADGTFLPLTYILSGPVLPNIFFNFYVKCTWKIPHVTYKKVILVVFVFYTLSHWILNEICLAKSRVTVQHTNYAAMSGKHKLTAPPETKNNMSILLYIFTFTDFMYLSTANGVKFLRVPSFCNGKYLYQSTLCFLNNLLFILRYLIIIL